jgi:hypothetical protein
LKKRVLNSSVCYLSFLAGPIQLASLQHRNAADRSLADTEKNAVFQGKVNDNELASYINQRVRKSEEIDRRIQAIALK